LDEKLIAPASFDSALISSFTHQIINPLNGVVGTIDNLIDGTIGQERREQRLKAVRAQLTHAIELVRNLAYLALLSTESGRGSLAQLGSRSTVPSVVIEAAMFFQELGSEKGVKIELQDRVTQYQVRGPKDLLRQVFTNLFENALKYGDDNSVVTVTPKVQKNSGALIVDVTNYGAGFNHAEREKIFERGYRGATAQGVLASGSGLGLFICREILAAAFAATIEGEYSGKKRTVTFRIRFPQYTIGEAIRSARR
jgi:signal transduction histidine kinase